MYFHMKKSFFRVVAVVAIAFNFIFFSFSKSASYADNENYKVFVTPESYGAIGDGIADDTDAWQKAIDSGRKVIATKSKYKCGTLFVNCNVDIDCGNAVFLCTDSVLFSCSGAVISKSHEKDCLANSNYQLSDKFTGIVYLCGTNNVFAQREEYRGGSIEEFHNGVMNSQIPIDCYDITAFRLNAIQVNIANISDVLFENEDDAVVISMQYCSRSVLNNINMSNVCYSVVQLHQCFNCTLQNSHFDIPQYKSKGTNYYPVSIQDSCYTIIQNVYARCTGWHCISTGNHTLCRGTKVINCQLFTDYSVPAYHDHENGIETTIVGSTLTSVTLGAFGRLLYCDVMCCKDDDLCHINLHMYSKKGLAVYILDGCRFYPKSTQNSGIRLYCAARKSGYDSDYYFDELMMTNCYNCSTEADMTVKKAANAPITGNLDFGKIKTNNSING